jgi:catechol 2,3-dioxygenase-like lactoylglutathione lyase family enzyme
MAAPMEVAISVNNMDRMLKFYTEVLGLKKFADNEVPSEMTTRVGQTPYGLRVVRLLTPNGEMVRLIQVGKPPLPGEVPRYIFERHGLIYVSFIVADLEGVLKRLKENHVKLVSGDRKIEVRPGVFVVYALDPEGNYVEFLEYPDIASYRPDIYPVRKPH